MSSKKTLSGYFVLFIAIVCLALVKDVRASVINTLVISEVFYDAPGADNELEWVELFNGSAATVVLDDWSLAFGGSSYANAVVALEGSLPPNAYFVIGGPQSSMGNGGPIFDQIHNFQPDLQNSGVTADAVALFNLEAGAVDSSDIPFDAVIYGTTNSSGLLDNLGRSTTVHVTDVLAGQSIERLSRLAWQLRNNPQPSTGFLHATLTPETETLLLLLTGIAFMVGAGCRPKAIVTTFR